MAEPRRSLLVDFLCPSEGCNHGAKDLAFLQVHLHSKHGVYQNHWMWPTKAKLLDGSYIATLKAKRAYKVKPMATYNHCICLKCCFLIARNLMLILSFISRSKPPRKPLLKRGTQLKVRPPKVEL